MTEWVGGLVLVSAWFVFFWGAVAYLLFRPFSRDRSNASPAETALQIAERRYASGEITRDEFEQLSHDLGGPTE